jgi:hypothetical protein
VRPAHICSPSPWFVSIHLFIMATALSTDACAGNVSRLHADPDGSNSALVIVTANVDQIHVLDRYERGPLGWERSVFQLNTCISSIPRFRLDKSYLMRGQVTWVGTSSMEISVRIADKEFPDHVLLVSCGLTCRAGSPCFLCMYIQWMPCPLLLPQQSAAFLMVARGADGTSARVPPLHCETEVDAQTPI